MTTSQTPAVDWDNIPSDCIRCDAMGCGAPGPPKRCARCKSAYYCSAECQKLAWKQKHKRTCRPLEECIDKLQHDDGFLNGKLSYSENDVVLATAYMESNTQCAICLQDSIAAPVVVKGCGHVFCSLCLNQWQRQTRESAASPINSVFVMNVFDAAPNHRRIVLGDVPTHCPTCRGEAGPGNVINVLVATSLQQLERAKNAGDDEQTPVESLGTVVTEIDKVLSRAEGVEFALCAAKAQILLFLQKPNNVLECLAEFDRVNDVDDSDRLGMQLLEAEAYIQLQEYKKALDRCVSPRLTAVPFCQLRLKHMLKAKCHYHLGQYDMAISSIDMILQMTGDKYRHYPGIRKYKALSEKAKGDTEAALTTATQAVLYESPYEDMRREESALDLYKALLGEMSKD